MNIINLSVLHPSALGRQDTADFRHRQSRQLPPALGRRVSKMVSPPLPEPGKCRLVAAASLMAGVRNVGSAALLWKGRVAVASSSRHYPPPSSGKKANTALQGAFSIPGLLLPSSPPTEGAALG